LIEGFLVQFSTASQNLIFLIMIVSSGFCLLQSNFWLNLLALLQLISFKSYELPQE